LIKDIEVFNELKELTLESLSLNLELIIFINNSVEGIKYKNLGLSVNLMKSN